MNPGIARQLAQQEEYRVRDTDGDREPHVRELWCEACDYALLNADEYAKHVEWHRAEAALLARPVEPQTDDEWREAAKEDAGKLLLLAAWFDMYDAAKADGRQAILDEGPGRNEVQQDLRRIAALLARRAPGDRDREPTIAQLAEVIHDAGPYEADGGVPDVCNRWPEHERLARHILDRWPDRALAADSRDDRKPSDYHTGPCVCGTCGRALAADSRPEQPAPLDVQVEQIERAFHPNGRCTECGGGEAYWKHGPGDPLAGYHMFQHAAAVRPEEPPRP